ncbi:MAG: FHA domain-containing protein [Spirochaetales bacterium]|nr:FHA domain-containing protein [Spirochaetales bacterium]
MLNQKKAVKRFWFLKGSLSDGNTIFIKIDTFPFVLGRDKKCHLFLSSKNVSRRHAEISLQGDCLRVRDLNSMNGTFINGKQISGSEFLRDDDTLALADQEFRIFFTDNRTAVGLKKTNFFQGPKKRQTFAQFYKLSKREEEVLFCLLQGRSSKAVAKKLFISEGTAKNHILKIFKKTNAHSRFALLALYNRFPSTKDKK